MFSVWSWFCQGANGLYSSLPPANNLYREFLLKRFMPFRQHLLQSLRRFLGAICKRELQVLVAFQAYSEPIPDPGHDFHVRDVPLFLCNLVLVTVLVVTVNF